MQGLVQIARKDIGSMIHGMLALKINNFEQDLSVCLGVQLSELQLI